MEISVTLFFSLSKSKSKNTTLFYIIKDYTKNGNRSTKIVHKIGNLEVIREEYDLFCQSLKCIHVSGTYSDQEGNQYLLKTTLDPSIQKKKY